ncbi:hypothetical protein [Cellulomonas pakistanensis]|uniref:Uncharacterized protein n=1 Tax=Cellulomonas pakistanensis TaxID=992287 RepID=A0A919PG03_9CELL|nr:hypothetical protein [Cellulomonas pakistanensis]GIG38179.1 hypothetical protein Cpa01nite_35600 [Cellulomonas pakistanensis]
MLTALLPGSRDLRTPLGVGLVLGVAAWIAIGPSFPTRGTATGFEAFIYRTVELIGPTAATALGISVAFLAGAVAVEVVSVASRIVAWVREDKFGLIAKIDPDFHTRAYAADRGRGARAFSEAEYEVRPIIESAVDEIPESIVRDVGLEASRLIHEIMGPDDEVRMLPISEVRSRLADFYYFRAQSSESQLAVRLRVQNKDLWDDYDRWWSEGELRTALAPALVLVVVAFSFQWTPWAMLGIVGCALVLRQGVDRKRRARAVVVQALVNGALTLPDLDALTQKVANARRVR